MSSNAPKIGLKAPRYVKGYPLAQTYLVKRLRRAAVVAKLLRQERPRRFAEARGTRYDRVGDLELRAQQGIVGSLEERIFYKALVQRWYIPDVDFTFQAAQLGGRTELGGLVADFILLLPAVVIQVQSAWHEGDLEIYERDRTQKALLENLKYTVMYVESATIHDANQLSNWLGNNVARLWGT